MTQLRHDHIRSNYIPHILWNVPALDTCLRYNIVISKYLKWWIYRIMCVLAWRNVYALTRGLFWCLFPELRSNQRNIHQNNTRVSGYTVRHKSTCIILFLTRHNESKNYVKNKDLHTSSPCLTRSLYTLLMTSQSIGDDVTMTTPLWREHVTSDI